MGKTLKERESLFGEKIADPAKEWQDMPEFVQEDLEPYRKIIVNFRNEDDVKAFAELVGQNIPDYQKKAMSIWFPYMPPRRFGHLLYVDEDNEDKE